MKKVLVWAGANVDVMVAVVLAIVILSLDITGVASTKIVQSATMATLAVVAIVLLRERLRGDTQGQAVLDSVGETHRRLDTLTHEFQRRPEVRVVSGAEANRVLEEARRETGRWVFRGATGAYIRAVTLPECVRSARPHRRRLDFRLEILDPMDPSLCEEFVGLHRRMAASTDSPERSWTVRETRRELYATILAACWHQQRYELLDIDVRLSSSYSLLRYELSTSCIIFTQRGPDFPALVVSSGTPSYLCWESELHVSFQQAKRLRLADVKGLPLGEEPTPDEIRAVFQGLAIELPAEYTDTDLEGIRRLALESADPYAHQGSA
ncbi:hypothetical protein [Actinomadura sp. 9N407]|uniref:hypothetical protein n=1 Tax=Actinomadura sp. 9N407 TaxID=3375154 RepID=UPI0037BB9951